MDKKLKKRYFISLIITFVLIVIFFAIALMIGRYSISIGDFFKAVFTDDASVNTQRQVIINLRLPRTIIALLTGIALSISGLIYQEIFQNKLTSPDLLGVSTGSALGAAVAIILGLSSAFVSIFAFVFGVITVFITVLISRCIKGASTISMILAGIIVGGFMSGLLSFVKFLADPTTTLAQITYWLLGSFGNAKMNDVYILAPIVLLLTLATLLICWKVNILSLGKEEAQTKGLNYNLYKYILIIIATLLTASTVAVCGTISWIGLVIPHIVRLIAGKNTKRSIPLCVTFGGSFMILVDIISRTFSDAEIPLSAVTCIFGTIVFVLILIFKRGNHYAG